MRRRHVREILSYVSFSISLFGDFFALLCSALVVRVEECKVGMEDSV